MYSFKDNKLKKLSEFPLSRTKRFVVLVMCGSFNPMHTTHIRLYECAKKKAEDAGMAVLGGFFSPVADSYGKPGLISFPIRKRIVEETIADHPDLEIDDWEGLQPVYTRTVYVLQHMQESVIKYYSQHEPEKMTELDELGIPLNVAFACGGDIFASFFIPKVWPIPLLQGIVDTFPIIVVSRVLGGVSNEEVLRMKMIQCSLCEEKDGQLHSLSFEKASVLFCVFDSPDDTSSTLMRKLASLYWCGDEEAKRQLEMHTTSRALDTILNAYKEI